MEDPAHLLLAFIKEHESRAIAMMLSWCLPASC